MVGSPLPRGMTPKAMDEITNDRLGVRLEGVVGELQSALVVDQRNSVDHRIKGAPPSFSHPPNPISEVVDGDQISLPDIAACPGNTKLDLGQVTVSEIPMGLEGGFASFPNLSQCGLQLLRGWASSGNLPGRSRPAARAVRRGRVLQPGWRRAG